MSSPLDDLMSMFEQFGGQKHEGIGHPDPLADLEKALLMDELRNYQSTPQTGTLHGMPGSTMSPSSMGPQMPQLPSTTATSPKASPGGGYSGGSTADPTPMHDIAKMMAMFSDRRLKTNIKPLGTHKGNQWYSYDYVWGEPGIGVMADEVPEAAFMHPSGFMMVDYSKVI